MITDVKVFPVENQGKVAARGNFLVSNVFKVSFTLFRGTKGLFVGLPGRYGTKTDENGKKIWYSDVYCTDEAVRTQMNETVIQAFNDKVGNVASQGEAPGPVSQEAPVAAGGNIPF